MGENGENGRIYQNSQKCPKMAKYPKMRFLGKYPQIEILTTTVANTPGRLDMIIILKTTPRSSLNNHSYLQLFLIIS